MPVKVAKQTHFPLDAIFVQSARSCLLRGPFDVHIRQKFTVKIVLVYAIIIGTKLLNI
jgi:hypothetical protein